jgi:hypothetical protein
MKSNILNKKLNCDCVHCKRNAYRVLVGKPEGKRPLGRPKLRVDLREIGWDDMDCIRLSE